MMGEKRKKITKEGKKRAESNGAGAAKPDKTNHYSAISLLLGNWQLMIPLVALFKAVFFVLIRPLLYLIFNAGMHLAGMEYLTNANLFRYLRTWQFWVSIILVIIVFILVNFFEFCMIIYLQDMAGQGQIPSIPETVAFAGRNTLRLLKPENLRFFAVGLVIYPFIELLGVTGYFLILRIPGVFLDYVSQNKWICGILAVGIALLFFLMWKWMFAIHYFCIAGCRAKEAIRRSTARTGIRHILKLLKWLLILSLFYAVVVGIMFGITALIYLIGHFLGNAYLLHGLLYSVLAVAEAIVLIFMYIFNAPIYFAVTGSYFYRDTENSELHLVSKEDRENPSATGEEIRLREKKERRKATILILSLMLAAAAVIFGYLYGAHRGWYDPKIEYLRQVEITGHRGDAQHAPENTMAAFEAAREEGADWVELDVQQSKDGVLYVMHDSKVDRTTDGSGYSWQLTWEEISNLDAGSWKGNQFTGEKVPLLSDVLDWARENNVKLNIELKPTGHEKNFAEQVVDTINEADYLDFCVVTSQDYATVEAVKEYDPDVQTVYVLTVVYGNLRKLTAADNFSVEFTNVSGAFVDSVHNQGKEVYVWTPNTAYMIRRMIDAGCDNIVTDNIPLARQTLLESENGSIVTEFIDLLRAMS